MNLRRFTVITTTLVLAGSLAACHPRCDQEEGTDHAAWMVERISNKLELNETQKTKLDALKTTLLTVRDQAQKQRDAGKGEILALLSQPTLDRARATALITDKTRAIADNAPAVVAAFGDFYDSLSADQQRELREQLESRLNGRWH